MPAGIYPLVPEDSTFFVGVTFTDKVGAPVTPTNIYWKIIDVQTGTVLQAEVEFTPPSQQIEITVLDAINIMVDPSETEELHRLIVRAVYAVGRSFKSKFDFAVERID